MFDESIRSLWAEPWADAHPSWLDTPAFATEQARLSGVCGPGLRFAQRLLLAPFGIDARETLTMPGIERLEGFAFDRESVQRAALFVGMVSHASFAAGGSAALANRQSRAASCGVGAWQEAFKMARARPLRSPAYDGPHDATGEGLLAQGAFYLRSSVDALQPGIWTRLRMRLDRRVIEGHRFLDSLPATRLDDATQRQVQRVWRAADALSSLISPQAAAA